MSEDELREYYNIFTECWRLFKKYSNPVNDQAFWDALMNETEELVEKSEKSEATKVLAVAVHRIIRVVQEGGKESGHVNKINVRR